jgi:putative ABC transport system substrate-binding protein
MRRHTLLAALCVLLGLIGLPFAAEAQQPKLHRLGFLANHSASRPEYQTFLQTLRELGYVEGKNIGIEARYAQDNFDRLPELVRLDVHLLFVSGDQGVKAAKEATDFIYEQSSPKTCGRRLEDPASRYLRLPGIR